MLISIQTAPAARDWQLFLVVGLLLGWPAMMQFTRPSVALPLSPSPYVALRLLLQWEPLPDSAASLVPDVLSLWPLARQEAVHLATLPRTTVALVGEMGAHGPRHVDLVRHLSLWLRRLGATLLYSPEHFPHLADTLTFHNILSAMLRIYIPAPGIAQEQADVLRPLMGGLLSHLDADPAVHAKSAVLQVQQLM